MKTKMINRTIGAAYLTAWSAIGAATYHLAASGYNALINYSPSTERNTMAMAGLVGAVILPFIALPVIDSAVDMVKGTKHYFLWSMTKRFSKDAEFNKKIKQNLELQLQTPEQPNHTLKSKNNVYSGDQNKVMVG